MTTTKLNIFKVDKVKVFTTVHDDLKEERDAKEEQRRKATRKKY